MSHNYLKIIENSKKKPLLIYIYKRRGYRKDDIVTGGNNPRNISWNRISKRPNNPMLYPLSPYKSLSLHTPM